MNELIIIFSYSTLYLITCVIAWMFEYEPGKNGFKLLKLSLIWPLRLLIIKTFLWLIKSLYHNLDVRNHFKIVED